MSGTRLAMMRALEGKLCVVTGASSGIGRAAAEALARQGARVIGCARRFAPLAEARLPEPGEMTEVGLDVTDEAAVRAAFACWPAMDVLINSAGIGAFSRIVDAEVAELRAMLDVHIVGTFLCCREALRAMRQRQQGHILAIGSIATTRPFPECGAYTAAKCGQAGLTRVLAEEARPHGVRVTLVTLGAIDTPIWDERPAFDRAKMMRAEDVAGLLVDVITRPALAVEEIVVLPPHGAL